MHLTPPHGAPRNRKPGPGRSLAGPLLLAVLAVVLVTAALLAGASHAEAATAVGGALRAVALFPAQTPPVASLDQVLTNMRNWMVGILAGLATVFLTLAGVRYILGSGDPGEIERAKVALRAAMVGYALAVLAPLLVTILRGIVGGP